MKVRNFLITLLILAAAGYGGLKLYYYNKVKGGVDLIVEGLSPVASVEYEMLNASIFDEVGIKGISIHIPNLQEEIYIEEIIMDKLFVDFLYMIDEMSKTGRPPADMQSSDDFSVKFKLVVNGLEKNVTLMEKIEREMNKMARQTGQSMEMVPEFLKQLGYRKLIRRMDDYSDLGYTELKSDFVIAMHYNHKAKTIDVHYVDDTEDMYRLEMKLQLDIDLSDFTSLVLGGRIKEFELKFTDYGYTDRLIGLYAKDNDMELEAYRELMINDFKLHLASKGIKLHEDTINNITAFLRKPDRLILTMYPLEPVGVNAIEHYAPGDIPRLLNFQAYYNEE